MSALALDGDFELVRRSLQRIRAVVDLAERCLCLQMRAENHMHTLKAAIIDHRFRTTRRQFFGMLVDEDHSHLQFILYLLQHLCYSKQRCSMTVMTARMHHTFIHSLEFQTSFLLDR